MIKQLTIASCVLLCFGARAQEVYQSVNIHTSDGAIHSYRIESVDSITVDTVQSVQQCKWFQTIENPGVADYLRDFEYDANDYTYHKIFDYRGAPYLDERQDWPYGVTVGDTTYFNLRPNRDYMLSEKSASGVRFVKIHTLGQLRQIKLNSINNVRDLGGWPTVDQKHIKYGLLYRGPELEDLSKADCSTMRNTLGIKAELDLRGESEITLHASRLGDDITYINANISYTQPEDAGSIERCVKGLRFVIKCLRNNQPVYIHCVYGADRTGLFCLLIEGLLGVGQSDLDKDYEITSFCGNTRYRTNENYQKALQQVLQLNGATLKEKFRLWWLHAGATEAELTELESLLTE